MINNNFLIKALIHCFGEAKTIKMLNMARRRRINKKARKYKASLRLL